MITLCLHSFRSAFFWYSQDARPKVRAANPDFGVGDVAKELGRQWGEINDETRDDKSSACFSKAVSNILMYQ